MSSGENKPPSGCGADAKSDGTGTGKYIDTVNQFPCSDSAVLGFVYAMIGWYILFVAGLMVFLLVVKPKRLAARGVVAAPDSRADSSTVNPMKSATSPTAEGGAPVSTTEPWDSPPTTLCSPHHVERRFYAGVLFYLIIISIVIGAVIPALRSGLQSIHQAAAIKLGKHANSVATGVSSAAEVISGPSPYLLVDSMLAIMYGGLLHLFIAPVVILLKLFGILKPVSRTVLITKRKDQKPPKENAWVLQSLKLTFWQKMFSMILGTINAIAMRIISVLAMVGLDLSVMWFPGPFFDLMDKSMLVNNMWIGGHRMYLSAAWHDAYLFFLFEKSTNFLTLTIYSRMCAAKSYNGWLDSRLRWLERPPPGCLANGKNVFFTASTPFCVKMKASFIAGLMPPFTTAWALLLMQVGKTDSMVFGGRAIRVTKRPTVTEWLMIYLVKSCMGWGSFWKTDLDDRIGWHGEPLTEPESSTVTPHVEALAVPGPAAKDVGSSAVKDAPSGGSSIWALASAKAMQSAASVAALSSAASVAALSRLPSRSSASAPPTEADHLESEPTQTFTFTTASAAVVTISVRIQHQAGQPAAAAMRTRTARSSKADEQPKDDGDESKHAAATNIQKIIKARRVRKSVVGWKAYQDDDGDVYFHNALTGETRWDLPVAK